MGRMQMTAQEMRTRILQKHFMKQSAGQCMRGAESSWKSRLHFCTAIRQMSSGRGWGLWRPLHLPGPVMRAEKSRVENAPPVWTGGKRLN